MAARTIAYFCQPANTVPGDAVLAPDLVGRMKAASILSDRVVIGVRPDFDKHEAAVRWGEWATSLAATCPWIETIDDLDGIHDDLGTIPFPRHLMESDRVPDTIATDEEYEAWRAGQEAQGGPPWAQVLATSAQVLQAARLEATFAYSDVSYPALPALEHMGVCRPAFGDRSLLLVMPDVAGADWDRIGDAREVLGIRTLRDHMREIERKALTRGEGGESAMWKAHQALLLAAEAAANEGLKGFAKEQAIGVSLGVAQQIPLIGILATGAQVVRDVAQELHRQERLLTVMLRVTGRLGAGKS